MERVKCSWLEFTITVIGFIALLLAFGMLTGCVTAPDGRVVIGGQVIEPQTVKKDIAILATLGTKQGLRADPNSREYFGLVLAFLNASIASENYDPVVLERALATVSARELRQPGISDGLQAAFALYAAHVGPVLDKKLDTTLYALPMLQGLRDGIAAGLLVQ